MITIEIPRQSVEAELKALMARVHDQPERKEDAFYLGAIQALRWINDGWAKPTERLEGRETL